MSLETLKTSQSPDKRWQAVETAMRRNGYRADALIESLHVVQKAYGYIDETAMRAIAAALRLPLSKVYGVVTFYHAFRLKPQGRHICTVCLGTACYIKGAAQLLEEIARSQGVSPGGTTADGRLSLLTARCVGACGLAPTVVVDDQVIANPETPAIIQYLDQLDGGEAQ